MINFKLNSMFGDQFTTCFVFYIVYIKTDTVIRNNNIFQYPPQIKNKQMNVHGFRDYNNNHPPQQYQNLSDAIPFVSNNQNDRPPLQQTIPNTLKTICCPSLKLKSISTFLSLLMVGAYIFCLSQGVTKHYKTILEVDHDVLLEYGAIQDILVKRGEVWRLITASLLHMNLLHILLNLICFLFLFSRLQKVYGIKVLIGILFSSAVSGNILSIQCNQTGTVSCGASGIIFGVIGTYIGFMTINWAALGRYGQIRSQICCTIGILVFFSILFSFGSDIDMYGHFGGAIGGFFASLALLPGIQIKQKKWQIIGWSCLGSYLLATLLCLFLI